MPKPGTKQWAVSFQKLMSITIHVQAVDNAQAQSKAEAIAAGLGTYVVHRSRAEAPGYYEFFDEGNWLPSHLDVQVGAHATSPGKTRIVKAAELTKGKWIKGRGEVLSADWFMAGVNVVLTDGAVLSYADRHSDVVILDNN